MAESRKPSEQRRTIRIAVDFPAKITAGKKKINCKAREFSEFGILLASDHKELVGTDVDLDLSLEGAKKPVSVPGVVVYATDEGLGVRFKNTTPEHRTILKTYLESHDPRTKPAPARV